MSRWAFDGNADAGAESSPLAARFASLARSQGSVTALRNGQPGAARSAYDFAKFWRRIERVTGHLQATWGIGHADRVAWLGLNHELQLVTLIACARLGAIFMPLNYRLAVAELRQVLDDAQPTLLVHDAEYTSTACALCPTAEPMLPGCRLVLQERLIDTASARDLQLPKELADTPVLLVFTSGTTGKPKGAVHTQAGLWANAQASDAAHGFTASDHVLSTLPLFHVGGLCIQTLPALLSGVSVTLHPRFEPALWLSAAAQDQPTLSLLVPATLRAVLDHPLWPDADLASLRGVMAGSSTIPLPYLQAFHDRGIPVGQIYGTTETGPVSIVLPLAQAAERIGSTGWPHALAQVQLRNEAGAEVPQGQTGQVLIRAPNVMQGYWQGPQAAEELSETGLQDGWFATGDLGQAAADGCITIVGRSKDMIISGGENIYPAEIENLLTTLAGVAACAVVGLDDARWGEVPVAAVVRAANPAGQALSEQAVLAHLQGQIARFKMPRRVVFVADLPQSALGKVQKPVLKAALQRQV
jgi:fatty-acyl-CoA synthase